MREWIREVIEQKILILEDLEQNGYLSELESAAEEIVNALKNGNKIILAGNGGSAADAQHFAGEIVGRFKRERCAMPAVSLCSDAAVVTCIANDYGYEEVFARQLQGIGKKGDIYIAISTSGNSPNCICAAQEAQKKGIKVIGLLGKNGGKLKNMCDHALVVPADSTPRIQEIHTLSVHLLCEIIEKEMFYE